MHLIKRPDAPTFDAGGTTVTGYAAPSRGADEVSLWQIELAPGSTSPLHYMDCEEVFLGLHGHAVAAIDGTEHLLGSGDCLILPAGAQATMAGDGATFVPPWAQ